MPIKQLMVSQNTYRKTPHQKNEGPLQRSLLSSFLDYVLRVEKKNYCVNLRLCYEIRRSIKYTFIETNQAYQTDAEM